MDKDKKDLNHENMNEEEIDWEAFFTEEDNEVWEKEKEIKRKRKSMIVKLVSSLLVLSLLVSGLQVWFNLFNIPAVEFVEASSRLSKDSNIKEYKKSVVTIEWDGVKGTGFNIDSNGLIVTNQHVVDHTNRVNVHFKEGGSYVGKVIINEPDLDLAIIDIEADNLPILQFATQKEWDIAIDEKIIFIGNPLAFTQIANEGTVVGEVTLNDWDIPVMMIEAPIYKGNSGSPVINLDGKVIGVIFATLQNPSIETKSIVGVATPSYYIEEILKDIEE
jgi:serine protease Do